MLDTILNVVLWLLSFLGITLLVVLGIVVFVLVLVLFVPIHYKGEFTKNPEVMQVQVKINWLLHIVRVYVNYEKELLIKAFVLFFKVFDSNKPAKVKKDKKQKSKNIQTNEENISEESSEEESDTLHEDKDSSQDTSEKSNDFSDSTENIDEEGSKPRQPLFTRIRNIIQNIICKCKSICDKIKSIVQNINYYIEILKEEETKLVFGRVLGRVLKVLKSIHPRKLNADILVGTGSPDTTGYLMAVAGMLYPYLGKHVNITPDFDNTIFEGRIQFKGRITVFVIIIHALNIYMDKELRNLVTRFKREDA